jgi:hypothetical protein
MTTRPKLYNYSAKENGQENFPASNVWSCSGSILADMMFQQQMHVGENPDPPRYVR